MVREMKIWMVGFFWWGRSINFEPQYVGGVLPSPNRESSVKVNYFTTFHNFLRILQKFHKLKMTLYKFMKDNLKLVSAIFLKLMRI